MSDIEIVRDKSAEKNKPAKPAGRGLPAVKQKKRSPLDVIANQHAKKFLNGRKR